MAVAARQVQVAAGKDHIVGVQRDVIIDPERGVAVQVEKVTAAIDLGDGNVVVAQQQRVTGVAAVPGGANQNRPAITDRPPAYRNIHTPSGFAGVKNQVRDAKQNSSNKGSFAVKFCDIVFGSVACLICVLILAALPIAMLVIGSIYLNDCEGQRLIPIWLIVFGCFSLVLTVINIFKRCCCKKKEDDGDSDFNGGRCCGSCLEFLMALFLFSWIIAGSVWVFGNYSNYQQDQFECHSVPYLFSFSTLIVLYSFTFLMCFCFCCCFCVLALTAAGDSDD